LEVGVINLRDDVMDNHIDPKVTAILRQLDEMQTSVILVGRTAIDQNRASQSTIKTLRVENDSLTAQIESSHQNNKRNERMIDVTLMIMIAGWSIAVGLFVMLMIGF